VRIATVILRVADLDRAVEFWSESVGLDLLSRFPGFAFLDGGGVQLVLNRAGEPVESLTEVVFEVEDVEAAYAEMATRGVPFEVELRPVSTDGERQLLAAHFRDPDGNLASLTGWVPAG
jgi:catechol 2,3-dioxygenase-like lactoylglutathione lyase family enzyme